MNWNGLVFAKINFQVTPTSVMISGYDADDNITNINVGGSGGYIFMAYSDNGISIWQGGELILTIDDVLLTIIEVNGVQIDSRNSILDAIFTAYA